MFFWDWPALAVKTRPSIAYDAAEIAHNVDSIAGVFLDLIQYAANRLVAFANRDDAALAQQRRQLRVLRVVRQWET